MERYSGIEGSQPNFFYLQGLYFPFLTINFLSYLFVSGMTVKWHYRHTPLSFHRWHSLRPQVRVKSSVSFNSLKVLMTCWLVCFGLACPYLSPITNMNSCWQSNYSKRYPYIYGLSIPRTFS